MSVRYRRGLVVGKFAPLHKGHERVIARALEACDEVLVLSYSRPELAGCAPEARARWLAELFPAARALVLTEARLASWPHGPRELPANDAPAEEHRSFVARVCLEGLGCTVDAVFASEDYGEGFARALTGHFQRVRPGSPPVTYVAVDPARREVPISGTAIRRDVHAHRAWLSPAVYASFVGRVGVLGGESSGKTTLAAELARACGTAWVAEHGRAVWEDKQGRLQLPDMERIAARQVALEDEAARAADRWLFCDTTPLTTLFYSQDLFGHAAAALVALAARPYAVTVLCAPDFSFVQDGTRRDAAFRDRQHRWYLDRLAESGRPFALVGGSVTERVSRVRALLDDLRFDAR